MDSNLTVLSTTNHIFNNSIFKLLTPQSLVSLSASAAEDALIRTEIVSGLDRVSASHSRQAKEAFLPSPPIQQRMANCGHSSEQF